MCPSVKCPHPKSPKSREKLPRSKKAYVLKTSMKMMRVSEDERFVFDAGCCFVGVKRTSEHQNEDGNSTTKGGAGSRSHPNDRRSDFRYDAEYNPSK